MIKINTTRTRQVEMLRSSCSSSSSSSSVCGFLSMNNGEMTHMSPKLMATNLCVDECLLLEPSCSI
ncbi:hypothetical protein Hanom_Chr03g00204831 [Helianthus anomalus]